jgi:hypothetical protein
MMREFLRRCGFATGIDRKEFDRFFAHGLKRSDFLLFGDEVICELKEILAINVEKQVAKLRTKGPVPTEVFNRYFCNSVINDLNKANEQIADTRIALNCPEALGLVVLENCIPAKLSALTLLGAADQLMLKGLPAIDGILCLDITNFFESPDGGKIRLCQLLRRESDAAHGWPAYCPEATLGYSPLGRANFCGI